MPIFSPELTKTIEGFLTRYETKRSSILPILHAIQDEKDWISDEDIDALEKNFGLSAVDVREVLTFYTMYRQTPPKPYRFEVCKSISCWLMGANDTIKTLRHEIEKAEKEGRPLPFEIHGVECLGQCGYAPSTLINKDRHNNVTPEKALQLLKEYSAKELPKAAVLCATNLAAKAQK
ncbi:complex I 24 kDa subunit family protein [Fluviispira sanaruensis]|uniref:NAD(P)H-dependent oxidoreductase subunit E n=1 Tax=Fluviispira sanaruensis TaxID=2493639 RepID=A0A4P2VNJ3_FLUSA|nr:NAD(P)H-dependent oxidoreductase subunit E [Fluviispira sanaruensis]BBH53714.1 NAD(P)H-dependent oxidoreductase subunit E [Fluviispira sanaruensis]